MQCTEKKKRKFWIALSREKIEEDIFIMTGSRPARRPRKRRGIWRHTIERITLYVSVKFSGNLMEEIRALVHRHLDKLTMEMIKAAKVKQIWRLEVQRRGIL
ncbi:hypothetical protein E2542_SST29920 [Spatholobus suberectus]|nr:hypothetical protein E2542_SST29920 [Spatholobus suberectus]